MVISAFLSGLIMAIGLIVSGMVYPSKVIGFLDIFGHFDPTLLFVMIGALLVTGLGFWILRRASKPVLSDSFHVYKKENIDAPLIYGSIIFGIGWGLAGFCPGPAIVGVGIGTTKAVVFVGAMLLGMFIGRKT